MDLVERLNEKINELEDELNLLRAEQRNSEYQDLWKWRHLRKLTEEENLDLPLPRLELRISRIDDFHYVTDYGLVLRHYLKHIQFVPFSSTKHGGGAPDFRVPGRDGAHIVCDMKSLNLRGFLVDTSTCRKAEVIGRDEICEIRGNS